MEIKKIGFGDGQVATAGCSRACRPAGRALAASPLAHLTTGAVSGPCELERQHGSQAARSGVELVSAILSDLAHVEAARSADASLIARPDSSRRRGPSITRWRWSRSAGRGRLAHQVTRRAPQGSPPSTHPGHRRPSRRSR
jgi:hypothetical protein